MSQKKILWLFSLTISNFVNKIVDLIEIDQIENALDPADLTFELYKYNYFNKLCPSCKTVCSIFTGKFVKNEYFAKGPCELCCHPELGWWHEQKINDKKIKLFFNSTQTKEHGIWYSGQSIAILTEGGHRNILVGPIGKNFIEISTLWSYYMYPYTTGLVRCVNLVAANGQIILDHNAGDFDKLVDVGTIDSYFDKDEWNEAEILRMKNSKICQEQISKFNAIDFKGDPYLYK